MSPLCSCPAFLSPYPCCSSLEPWSPPEIVVNPELLSSAFARITHALLFQGTFQKSEHHLQMERRVATGIGSASYKMGLLALLLCICFSGSDWSSYCNILYLELGMGTQKCLDLCHRCEEVLSPTSQEFYLWHNELTGTHVCYMLPLDTRELRDHPCRKPEGTARRPLILQVFSLWLCISIGGLIIGYGVVARNLATV